VYAADQSSPTEGRWCFHYNVTILNEREEAVQLLRRRWQIADLTGRVDVVEGPGVVGRQPVIAPGTGFGYRSGCILPTPLGWMEGTYELRGVRDGTDFLVPIPRFELRAETSIH
jgi:ApaG protein